MSRVRADAGRALRRETVSRLLVRQLTLREIVEYLASHEILNPDTSEPYDEATVSRDRKAITEEWQRSTLLNVAEHRGRILAELAELKRKAWEDKNFSAVLKALSQEADILPVKAPAKPEGAEPNKSAMPFAEALAKVYADDADAE